MNDFFTVDGVENTGNSYICSVSLNVEHIIYKSHFPNNPITPGVCLLQMSSECLEQIIDKKLLVDKIKNLKFLTVLSPREKTSVKIVYDKLIQTDSGCTVQIVIKSEETQYVKVAISYIYGL